MIVAPGGKFVKGVEQLLTPADLAQVLSLSKRTVFVKFIRSGVIPSRKFGARSYRVRPADLAAWLARGCNGERHKAEVRS